MDLEFPRGMGTKWKNHGNSRGWGGSNVKPPEMENPGAGGSNWKKPSVGGGGNHTIEHKFPWVIG